jgi:hypothetical protein
MPLQALPCLPRLAGAAVSIENPLRGIWHFSLSTNRVIAHKTMTKVELLRKAARGAALPRAQAPPAYAIPYTELSLEQFKWF